MRPPTRWPLAWTLPLFLLACGDSTGPEAEDEIAPCTEQTGSVAVDVGDGLTPTFGWTPACAVAMVLVEEGASDMWGVSTDEDTWANPAAANLIAPPVTYGVTPSGATPLDDDLPLEAGHTYELVLWRIIPASSTANCQQRFDNACLLAVHQFTR